MLLLFLCERSLNSVDTWSGLPWWLNGKVSTCNAGDTDSIPGSARSPGGGHGNPLQYSCLGNHTDWGAWWAAVHKVAKNLKWLGTHMCVLLGLLLGCVFHYTDLFCCQYYTVLITLSEWVIVAQSCLTLCSPMDCSPPGSFVHGILQARMLEWVAICFL